MSIKTPELVLFDLDGTLVDSVSDLAFSLNKTLKELKLPERKLEEICYWVGDGIEKFLKHALNEHKNIKQDDLYDEAIDKFSAIYMDNIGQNSDCYCGIREGLEKLKQMDIPMGCVTNKRSKFAIPILKKLNIMKYMDIVIAGDTLPKKKPDPLPLLHVASVFDKDPANSLMIGDSENDINAARAAGFKIVCVSYGYNRGKDLQQENPDAIIDSLLELFPLFS